MVDKCDIESSITKLTQKYNFIRTKLQDSLKIWIWLIHYYSETKIKNLRLTFKFSIMSWLINHEIEWTQQTMNMSGYEIWLIHYHSETKI